jgi:hypothetical protein
MRVQNDDGMFEFQTDCRRWLCIQTTRKGRREFAPRVLVPYAYAGSLSAQARAEGATSADFGIVEPKVKKPRAPKAPRKPRQPRKVKARMPEGFVPLDLGL